MSCKFLRCHTLDNFPFIHNVSRAGNTSEPSKSEKQTLVANSDWCLARLGVYVAREHGWILVSNDTAKGIACETRSEPQWFSPSQHPWLPGCTINAKSLKNRFAHISGDQHHFIVLAFLLYEQISIFFFPEKGAVWIIRNSTVISSPWLSRIYK